MGQYPVSRRLESVWKLLRTQDPGYHDRKRRKEQLSAYPLWCYATFRSSCHPIASLRSGVGTTITPTMHDLNLCSYVDVKLSRLVYFVSLLTHLTMLASTPDFLAHEEPDRRAAILDFLEPLMLRAYEVDLMLRLLLASFQHI